MTLAKLDSALRRSAEAATPFARGILVAGAPWSAEVVREFINQVRSATVATVSNAGVAHAAWVPVRCIDGDVFVLGSVGSTFLRNVTGESRVGFTVVAQGRAVFGQGLLRPFLRRCRALSGSKTSSLTQFDVPGDRREPRFIVLALTISRVFAT